ncbi:hypothetical protein M407DRAFT_24641 [Tulasnella calospora MUT 4182]|uniref:Uncharacterized protein n=1 Tax=Tulasnella calospora MUT 4182 TaxID=1051891 RepID=A0A0C3KXE1_9AGAM|nr:hypothetical protein M407DRAFT_24641 [Tulasnella calospora MUT 4182]
MLPHATSETALSGSVRLAKPSGLLTTSAHITTRTPLSAGVIARPEFSTWHGVFNESTTFAFIAAVLSIALIIRLLNRHTVGLDRPAAPSSPLNATITGLPSRLKARQHRTVRLAPKAQPNSFICASYLPYSSSSNGPESATTGAFNQTFVDHIPVLASPPSFDNNPPKSTESNQSVDETLPLLGWNFTTSSIFQEEDDDVDHDEHDDEEIWLDAEGDEQIQIKEVSRGIVPFPYHVGDEAEAGDDVVPAPTVPARIQELIPTSLRGINPSIELLQPRATQEAIAFPSREDEKHQGPAPPTSTPAPTGAPRTRLRVPAAKPTPIIQSLKPQPAQEDLPLPSRKDKDENEDGEDQATQQGRPSVTRSPSRPRLRIPTGWRYPKIEVMQGLKPLPACHCEARDQKTSTGSPEKNSFSHFTVCLEEEEDEEDSPDQDRLPSSTSKPNHDTSTSTTSTAVETPTIAEVQNTCGKRSAMKKKTSKKKTATVSFLHFTEVRNAPKTIWDQNARTGRFASMQKEEGLDRQYRLLKNLLGPEYEEVEENRWIPLESEEPELQPSLLSWNAVPQDDAALEAPEAPEKINRSGLRKMFTKLFPLRSGTRLFKEKTGPA